MGTMLNIRYSHCSQSSSIAGMRTKKVAFLGLGAMGAPMARRLLDPAFELTVWNRSPERSQPFSADGVRIAATAAEAADGADVVVTMLADGGAVQQVISDIAPVLRAIGKHGDDHVGAVCGLSG